MPLHPEQKRIYQSMTPAQKLHVASRLYYSAREIKRAGLRSRHAGWSDAEIEKKIREIFLYART